MKLVIIGKGFLPFPCDIEQKLIRKVTWLHLIVTSSRFLISKFPFRMSGVLRTTSRYATPLGDPRGVPKFTKLNPSTLVNILLGCLEGFGARRRRRLKVISEIRGIQYKMEDINDLLLFPDFLGDDILFEILRDIEVEDIDFDYLDTNASDELDTVQSSPNTSVVSLWQLTDADDDTNAPKLYDKNAPTLAEISNENVKDFYGDAAIATTATSHAYEQSTVMQIDNSFSENQCFDSQDTTSKVKAAPRGQKRKSSYESMRRRNNESCKAYREREKAKKRKLQKELETESEKNRLLHKTLDEKKNEVQRLQNLLIFNVYKPKVN